jgi:hypothetical protein
MEARMKIVLTAAVAGTATMESTVDDVAVALTIGVDDEQTEVCVVSPVDQQVLAQMTSQDGTIARWAAELVAALLAKSAYVRGGGGGDPRRVGR